MATLNAAQAHGLDGFGAIAPGFRADLVVLDDLDAFRPSLVLAGGRVAARDGVAEPFDVPETPAHVLGTVRSAPVTEADLALEADGEVRVIEIVPEQLITIQRTVSPARSNGHVVSDPTRDLAKIAVIERHHATGRVGRGLVTGFGLRARRASPPPSPTTPTTSSPSGSTTPPSSPAPPACRSSGAAASWPSAAGSPASSPSPSPACSPTARSRRSSPASTSCTRRLREPRRHDRARRS